MGWALTGNGDVTDASRLGTTGNVTLTMMVSGTTALRIMPASTGAAQPNIVGGIAENSVSPGVVSAVIGGGGLAGVVTPNQVTDSYGVVGGGSGNVAGNGNANVVDAAGAVVAGGSLNSAAGQYAAVGGGSNNSANSAYSVIPGGSGAAARVGSLMYATGTFGGQMGSAQTGTYVLRGETSGAQERDLYIDGTSQKLTIPPGYSVFYDMSIVGRSPTGLTGAWHLNGMVKDVNGVVSAHETTFKTEKYTDVGFNAYPTVQADTSAVALNIHVTSAVGDSIRWVATVNTTEVYNAQP